MRKAIFITGASSGIGQHAALAHFGQIDVVLNNAGYGMIGAFETFDKSQIEIQFQTNVFGLMAVTRALLPHMRERRIATFINVTRFARRSISLHV